jgi:hypothetical protein
MVKLPAFIIQQEADKVGDALSLPVYVFYCENTVFR